MLISNEDKLDNMYLNDTKTTIGNNEKLFGLLLIKKLNLVDLIKSLCKITEQKRCAIARISSCPTLDQKLLLIISFLNFQFNYCILTWKSVCAP